MNIEHMGTSQYEKSAIERQAEEITNKLEKWADEHTEYAMGYSLEDEVKELLGDALREGGKDEDDVDSLLDGFISYESKTEHTEDSGTDNGKTKGILTVGDGSIEYSSLSDGYDFCLNTETQKIREVIKNALEKLQA